ncbi:unnamed protein product [Plutella xylostella]|uniref:(diamondback moth) hypothetical protein n=1 Tax=Plutella xylostella TaxID=51655 RepID=A0A8S4DS48_PLUXY|nr:unnamed protein product [Plutella xylostella]
MILAPETCECPFQDPGASIASSPNCNGLLLFMALMQGFVQGRCAIADPCNRVVGVKEVDEEYDFIVVGGGAAGPIVAGRLAENDKFKVLLIEAGGPDPVASRVPSYYRNFWNNAETDWLYRTQLDNYCLSEGKKGCVWPRGKTLGGSAVLNGMMYHRGHAADFDEWTQFGAEGWSWKENLPYFYKTEDNKQIGTLVNGSYHATGGPLPIQQFRYTPEFVYDLLKGIEEVGLPVVADMNDPNTPEGFAIAQTFSDDGQRYTTARAYLKPKENLHVLLNSHVSRVLFNDTVAVGVEYITKTGERKTVQAAKEVILSAGALNSPHILLLSGVGPKETLDKFDIPVVADLPDVGQNLKNHIGMTLFFVATKEENTQSLDWAAATEYLLERTGPMTSTGITQMSGVLYSSLADRENQQPDLQFFFNGFYAECSSTGAIGEPVGDCPQKGRNITSNAVSLRPRSVGYLTLNSTNPLEPPLFFPQYFSHPDDMVMVKDGGRYVRQIMESEAIQSKYGVKLDPAYTYVCDNRVAQWSDEWLECMARWYTDPQNHQVGTAAISRVVDNDLRVYNVTGLRVIDASAIPILSTGNPQGAIMMVAERGADSIKADWSQ